jgi:tripartite-type tricarboxylate transporter receptor subunit TctC
MQRREFNQTAIAAMLSAAASSRAFAQAGLPLEQVKIINGFPAGGTVDATSRRVGDKLAGSRYTRNAAVVENKTGAGGRIACEAVKAAPADGSTLLLTPYSMMSVYPHIYSKLSYDPVKDFAPVCIGASLVHGLAVGPMVPASVNSVKGYLAWAKANPKDASYGSPAAGSTPHFLGALLGLNNGVDIKHIPYRGSVPGVADVMGGQLASMVTPVGDFLAHHKAGKLRVIATSGRQRSGFLPEVPTFIEQGFSDLMVEEWFGFYAPAATPAATIAAANAAINQALKDKSLIDSLALQGLLPVGGTAAEMARSQKEQLDHWGPLIKKIGFTAEA